METFNELRDFFENGHKEYRANLVVDCAIFGYRNETLKLLLTKNKVITKWCLPGGYVKKNETLDEAAARVTALRTGIENLFLKQFKTFADPERNKGVNTFDSETFFELTGIHFDKNSWLATDTASVGYYAITNIHQAALKEDFLSSECRWFAIDELPTLGFDHEEMVREALEMMRMQLYHFPIGKSLLPDKFTLKDIKCFYEVMSGKSLHASNFPNKLLSIGLLEKLEEKKSIGAHRSPTYYRFNEEKYQLALKEGLVLV